MDALDLWTRPNSNCKILAIHTDQYAGNFERELCAFLTMSVGDCGVGGNYAKLGIQTFEGDLAYQDGDEHDDIEGWVEQFPSENGYYRPVTGAYNADQPNTVAIYFYSQTPESYLNLIMRRCNKYVHNQMFNNVKILGYSICDFKITLETLDTIVNI